MRANTLALILALAAPAAADPIAVVDISENAVQGLSGIELSDDGLSFLAVSDRGWFHLGTLERVEGTLTGGRVTEILPIIGQDGIPVSARRVGDWSDAEGLAITPDGTIYVSFERWMRVARYTDTRSPAQWIKDHPDFRTYPENRQLEAVAVDAAGTIYAFPESEAEGGGFPIYRLDPDGWSVAGRLPASDAYSVVGADFGPDGALYVLERKLVFATWFRSRIRQIDVGSGADRVVWESPPDAFGNLEGLSVWQAQDGLRALMVSDNNGQDGVPTILVELRLTD